MYRDVSLCNTYNYGDARYWDARYEEEGGSSFDWYQRYSALCPFVRKFVPTSSRVLMVGCGNAVMSEDMVKDGYADIMNIDISSVVIEMMRKKYAHVPQLKYMQMDVRDMSFFQEESFDCVIDKGANFVVLTDATYQFLLPNSMHFHGRFCLGTLDSLMCGTDALLSASQMLKEVNRLLRPGGIYMLITYGDPSVRIPHLNQAGCCWKFVLYVIPRPGFQSRVGCSSPTSIMEPVPLTERGLLPASFVLEDPDSHYIYICKKMDGSVGDAPQIPNHVGEAIAQ